MRYLIAIFLPPLAILMCGNRVGTAMLNCLLCLLLWVPGVVHACLVISAAQADKRTDRLIRAMERRY